MPPKPTIDVTGLTDEQKRAVVSAASFGSGVNIVNTPVNIPNVPPPVSVDSVTTPPKPYTVPSPYSTAVPDTTFLDQQFQKTQEEQKADRDIDLSLEALRQLTEKEGQATARKAELTTKEGLPDMNKQLNELYSQIRSNNVQTFTQQQIAEDRLAPNFAIQGDQQSFERQTAVKNFALSAAAEALQGNIAQAEARVQSALDTEFTPIKSQIDYQKAVIERNYDKFDDSTKRAADKRLAVLAERERTLAEDKEQKNAIYNLIPIIAQKAGNEVVNSVLASKSLDEALKKAAPFLAQQNNSIVKLENGRTILIDTTTGNVVKDLGGAEQAPSGLPQAIGDVEYGTTPYYEALFSGTKGGKQLTGDQTTPLVKASIVLNQVDDLAKDIDSTVTDPILGFLRDNNPYDVKARLIRAELRSTVPNLARGVYGEVGVLTDADINNYIQTLPNIRTPQQANDLVTAMTLTTIKNSFQSYLETYAASGRDVSGFVPKWKSMNQQIDSILSGLSPQIDPTLMSKYNSAKSSAGADTGGDLISTEIASFIDQLFRGY